MFKAAGFTDADLARPVIGIANTWIEIGPCNYHLRELARSRARGHSRRRRHGDGIQHRLHLRRHHDGHAGNADVARQPGGHRGFDRAGRVGQPARRRHRAGRAATRRFRARRWRWRASTCRVSCSTADRSPPGHVNGRDVTIQDVFEGVGAHAAGRLSADGLRDLENRACPGAGACGGQFTANTMAGVCEFLGLSPMGSASVPAVDPAKRGVAVAAGRLVADLVRRKVTARDDPHAAPRSRTRLRRSPPPAARRTPSCTCWRSPARRAWISISKRSTRSMRACRGLPTSSRPAGTSRRICIVRAARAWSRVALRTPDLLKADAITVTRPIDRRGSRRRRVKPPGQDVVRPIDAPLVGDRRTGDSQGHAGAGGLRAQSRRPSADDDSRHGARVRRRGSGLCRGAGRRHPRR